MRYYISNISVSHFVNTLNKVMHVDMQVSDAEYLTNRDKFNFMEYLINKAVVDGYIEDEDIVMAATIIKLRGDA